nr:hypothetical protein [Morchella crassipes]
MPSFLVGNTRGSACRERGISDQAVARLQPSGQRGPLSLSAQQVSSYIYVYIYNETFFGFFYYYYSPASEGGGEAGRAPLRASPSLHPPQFYLNFFYSEKTCLF